MSVILILGLALWLWRSKQGADERLEFFWSSSNGVGVLSAVLIALLVWQRGRWSLWRLGGVPLGLFAMYASEAYAAWIALGVALLFARSHPVVWWLRGVIAVAVTATVAWQPWRESLLQGLGPLLSGREGVWETASRLISAFPWGGTGPYQYGSLATPFADRCQTSGALEGLLNSVGGCPVWLEQLGQPWLIAHSGWLHALAETGMVGTAGWLLLWGVLFAGVWKSRWHAGRAVFLLLLTVSLVDNVTLVPSPGYAELFYLIGGAGLGRVAQLETKQGAMVLGLGAGTGGLLALGSAAAVWLLSTPTSLGPVQVQRLLLPAHYQQDEVYAFYADLRLPDGPAAGGYLAVEQCADTVAAACTRIGGALFEGERLQDWVYARILPSYQGESVRLRVTLASRNRVGARQLLREWTVERVK
ncbi:hypothetical protein QOL99_02415 [Deinococcus sp. MIMF12]|uniref:O-antigen ligase domain-containing protein n=1 Tax=Deinococcus rhizophilus TaxID=3049544 RepID=A0ABT7JGA9_9DEIO|nr:hypothetical protein [Deinococcus rhizophilus]MDL2342998.1 hypothetical protein [Deinococcus rhizophilus]